MMSNPIQILDRRTNTTFATKLSSRCYRVFIKLKSLCIIINRLTDLPANKESLRKITADIATLVRRFNLWERMNPEDEKLPPVLHIRSNNTGDVMTEEKKSLKLKDYLRHSWHPLRHIRRFLLNNLKFNLICSQHSYDEPNLSIVDRDIFVAYRPSRFKRRAVIPFLNINRLFHKWSQWIPSACILLNELYRLANLCF